MAEPQIEHACDQDPVIDLVPTNLIDANPDQPRRTLLPAGLEELTESIRQHGVLQPVRVRRRGPRYEMIAGHRRLLAARRAGLEAIPAVVVDIDDDRALIESLVENIQREDLNPLERGEALRRLRVNLGAQSWEEVGRRIGISRRHVYHLLNIAELPEPIREDVRSGLMSEKHGRALVRLRKDADLQARLWQRIATERMSGDEALEAARDLIAEREGCGRPPEPDPVDRLRPLVEELHRLLPRTPTPHVRPLRSELRTLARRLQEVLTDAFYAEEQRLDASSSCEARPRRRQVVRVL